MVVRDRDLGDGPEAKPDVALVPTARDLERLSERSYMWMGAIFGVPAFIVTGGFAGNRLGYGVAELVVQGSNEWAVRAGGNIGLGAGILIASVCTGVALYRFFRS